MIVDEHDLGCGDGAGYDRTADVGDVCGPSPTGAAAHPGLQAARGPGAAASSRRKAERGVLKGQGVGALSSAERAEALTGRIGRGQQPGRGMPVSVGE